VGPGGGGEVAMPVFGPAGSRESSACVAVWADGTHVRRVGGPQEKLRSGLER